MEEPRVSGILLGVSNRILFGAWSRRSADLQVYNPDRIVLGKRMEIT